MGPALQAFIGRAVEDAGPYEILSVNGAKSSAVRRDAGRRSFCDCQNHSSYISPQGLMEMLAAEICAFGLGLAFLLGKRKKYGYM